MIQKRIPEAVAELKMQFRELLAREGACAMKLRTRAAINLNRSANSVRGFDSFRSIDRALAQQDQGAVRELLAIAEIVSGEPQAL